MRNFKVLISILLFAGIALFFNACTTVNYSKILKGGDANLKLKTANDYYEIGNYPKAMPLYEDLISMYRGTTKSQDIYFRYAYCNYYLKDYIIASYYFNNFVKTYPTSKYTEEAMFMSGISDYKSSPVYSLDQSDSYHAIDNLQSFMAAYPNSNLIDSCNVIILELRAKLEKKAFENAYLYYKLEDYKGALIAFKGVLRDFPESHYKEDVLYWMLVTRYEIANKSVFNKKAERLQDTINSYYKFIDTFPDSKRISNAEHYFKLSLKQLDSINS